MSEFIISRICNSCHHQDQLAVSKREAAFDLVDIHSILGPCSQCGSTSFSTSLEKPVMDFELLKEWVLDDKLQILSQDEDLVLADNSNVDIILDLVDNYDIGDYKLAVLISALCVIVNNNAREGGDEALKNRVIDTLNQRSDKLQKAGPVLYNYVQEVITPLLSNNN